MREYRIKNKNRLSQQILQWKTDNRLEYRLSAKNRYHSGNGKRLQNASLEKSAKTFLSKKIATLAAHARSPGPHDPKDSIRREFDIDIDYVLGLLEQQNNRCALSSILMTTKIGELQSISIDRIDSSKGHIKGNVHLICEGINYMKRHRSIKDVQSFINQIIEAHKAIKA